MKIIGLLNKIANGEIEEDTMFEYSHGNGYKEYCTAKQFFNRYIVDKENLNLEIYEDKPFNERVEKITNMNCIDVIDSNCYERYSNKAIALDINTLRHQINKIIDYLEDKQC